MDTSDLEIEVPVEKSGESEVHSMEIIPNSIPVTTIINTSTVDSEMIDSQVEENGVVETHVVETNPADGSSSETILITTSQNTSTLLNNSGADQIIRYL